MTSRNVQMLLALIFIGLGGWCLLMPRMVESLAFRPEYLHLSTTSMVLIGCFGAQAVLVGVVIATTQFRPSTFLVFGIAGSLPFFVFNYYFYFIVEVFTKWMLLDFVGNICIFTLSIIGYRLKLGEAADRR